MMTRRGALAGASVIALAGCTEVEQRDDRSNDDVPGSLSGEINIAGSSTVFPLMSAIAEEFYRVEPGVRIDLSSTGTGGGFRNFFCEGQTHFNNASRSIGEEEVAHCESNGVEWLELQAAIDALTVVVNNDNDVLGDPPTLTIEELSRIWEADAASTWNEINDDWPDERIDRYGPGDTSGTFDFFLEHVQGASRGHTDDYQATEHDNTIAQGVAGDQYAIGYFGFSYWYQNQGEVTPVAIDGGDGPVQPSLETAASGEYSPLSRPLYTYLRMGSLAEPHVVAFARFFIEQTGNVDLIADDVGYAPVTAAVQETQKQQLEAAIASVQGTA